MGRCSRYSMDPGAGTWAGRRSAAMAASKLRAAADRLTQGCDGAWRAAFPVSVSLPSRGLEAETSSGNGAAQSRRGGRPSPGQAPRRPSCRIAGRPPAQEPQLIRADQPRITAESVRTLILRHNALCQASPSVRPCRRRVHEISRFGGGSLPRPYTPSRLASRSTSGAARRSSARSHGSGCRRCRPGAVNSR